MLHEAIMKLDDATKMQSKTSAVTADSMKSAYYLAERQGQPSCAVGAKDKGSMRDTANLSQRDLLSLSGGVQGLLSLLVVPTSAGHVA